MTQLRVGNFHTRFFVDAKCLRKLSAANKDANIALPQLLARMNATTDRAVVFLDPYGMSVEWATLEQVSRSRLADLWYLFPLSGFYRQATTDATDISSDKEAALNRMLGTNEWRTALYAKHPQSLLFGGQQSDVRTADPIQMLDWVKTRLKLIFPGVAEPKLLYQTRASGKQGAPLFALFFAVSNPSQKAVGLALRIANDILKN